MKSTTVADSLYLALETEAKRSGRTVQELVGEAIESWLADSAMDAAERDMMIDSRKEAAGYGGTAFESFFSERSMDKN